MFWRNLKIGLLIALCLIAGVIFVVWIDGSKSSSASIVPPANSGQQKQFY